MDNGINPQTADYTGKRVASLQTAITLRIMTPLGSWWADPTLGSRLHELAREKDLNRVRRLAEQYAARALQPLLDDGRAASVSVHAGRPASGWCSLSVAVQDISGNRETYQYQVKVI